MHVLQKKAIIIVSNKKLERVVLQKSNRITSGQIEFTEWKKVKDLQKLRCRQVKAVLQKLKISL